MVTRWYRNVDAVNPRGGYRKPSILSLPNFYHRDGHYVKPNMVGLKYPDFKKDVDLNVHVKVFNSTVKVNVEKFEEYIINAFRYMLRDITLN
jgi:hypothetical protein